MPVGIKTYNGKTSVYIFPNSLSPIIESFEEYQVIEAFDYVWLYDWSVDETNHIILIRTDSPVYKLDSGFGVGSSALEVKNYYESLYDYVGDSQSLTYSIGENTNLSFTRDTEELTEDSIIMYMQISLSSWE